MSGSDVSVSLVIPTWRGAEHISLLLQSLWRQTLCPLEVILIDSSSTDGTEQIASDAGCIVKVVPKTSSTTAGPEIWEQVWPGAKSWFS